MTSELKIDWLQGTIPHERVEDFLEYMTRLEGYAPACHEYGRFRYNRQAFFPSGLIVYYDASNLRAQEVHKGRATIVISSTALLCVKENVYQLIKDLVFRFWFKGTRIDLAFDDFKKLVPMSVVAESARAGHYTRFKKHCIIEETRRSGDIVGNTIYFGSRGKNGGGRFIRVYDKTLESKGRTDSNRWEIEFTKEKASSVVFELSCCDGLEQFVSLIASLIGGSIDFVQRKDRHLERAERLEWWQTLVDILGECTLAVTKKQTTIHDVKQWVRVSVAPSLKMIRVALGDQDFNEWLECIVSSRSLTVQQMEKVNNFYCKKIPF